MNLDNIDFSTIRKSKLIVSYPFVYDKEKILQLDTKSIVKLNKEHLLDFLPYTQNNFFGDYHLKEKSELKEITTPCILKHSTVEKIDFINDKTLTSIDIDNIKIYIFEKDIALLSISYNLPVLTQEEYLQYHHKLTHIGKRDKQSLETSDNKSYKYYYQFIDELVEPYAKNKTNLFLRTDLYSYNILVCKKCDNPSNSRNFLEPLTQYRTKLSDVTVNKLNASVLTQASNVHTISNENVTIHIGIENEKNQNTYIKNEFISKYSNNHFLTYIITVYQVSKITQLITKAFLKEVESHDIEIMRIIKEEILHFISNGNFTKISNNSIRNNLYKFYRESMDLKDMLEEIDTISEKVSAKLERSQNERREKRERKIEGIITTIGIVLTILGIVISLLSLPEKYQIKNWFDSENKNSTSKLALLTKLKTNRLCSIICVIKC